LSDRPWAIAVGGVTRPPALLDPVAYWGDPRPLEIMFPFSKTDVHLYLAVQFIFDGLTAGRCFGLSPTPDSALIVPAWPSLAELPRHARLDR
jgi:hypothetical protein